MKLRALVITLSVAVVSLAVSVLWFIRSAELREAIEMAKSSNTLSAKESNADYIRSWLESARGMIIVGDWKATRVRTGVFLVTLPINDNGGKKGYAFEVVPAHSIVRNVFASPALVAAYGFPVFSAEHDAELAETISPGSKSPADVRISQAGELAVTQAPELFKNTAFFHAYLRITDNLDITGYRLEMPTPEEFITEQKAKLAQR